MVAADGTAPTATHKLQRIASFVFVYESDAGPGAGHPRRAPRVALRRPDRGDDHGRKDPSIMERTHIRYTRRSGAPAPQRPRAVPTYPTHSHLTQPTPTTESRHGTRTCLSSMQKQSQHGTVQREVAAGADQTPSSPRHRQGRRRSGPPPLPPNANSPPHHSRAGARGEEGPRHHSRRMPTPLPVCRRILHRASTHYGAVPEGQRRPVSSQTWVYRRATQPQHHPSSLSVNRCSSGSSSQIRPQKRPPPTAPPPPPRRRRRHSQTPPSARRPPPPLRAPPPRRLRDDGGWRPPWWPQGGPPLEAAPGGPWQRKGRGERCESGRGGTTTMPRGGSRLRGPRTAAVGARVCRSSSERTGGNDGGGVVRR